MTDDRILEKTFPSRDGGFLSMAVANNDSEDGLLLTISEGSSIASYSAFFNAEEINQIILALQTMSKIRHVIDDDGYDLCTRPLNSVKRAQGLTLSRGDGFVCVKCQERMKGWMS